MFKVTPETSRPHPRNLSAHLLNLARYTGIDTTKREQKGRHRTNGHRNPQKEKELKKRSLHEGVENAMTSKLSTWQTEH